jgi:putative molybdopterin biosynthesis protein
VRKSTAKRRWAHQSARSQGAPAEVLIPMEVARLLRIGRNTVYEMIARGVIPSIRVGRRLLVPRVQLSRWLDSGSLDKSSQLNAERNAADCNSAAFRGGRDHGATHRR